MSNEVKKFIHSNPFTPAFLKSPMFWESEIASERLKKENFKHIPK